MHEQQRRIKRFTDAVRAGYRAPLTVAGWEAALWRFTTAPRDNGLAGALDADVFDQARQPLTAASRAALRQKVAAAAQAA